MDIGLIGLPGSGKSALYRGLTGTTAPAARYGAGGGVETLWAPVPDARLDAAAIVESSRKTTYAQVAVSDVTGLISGDKGTRQTSAELLGKVRQFDLLVILLRAFRSEAVPHILGSVNPERDLAEVESELMLGDLTIIERRIEKIRAIKTPPREERAEYEAETALLEKIRAQLENGIPVRAAGLDEADHRRLAHFAFLTAKEPLFCLNVDDDRLNDPLPSFLEGRACVAAAVETEGALRDLDEVDRAEFAEALGVEQPLTERMMRAVLNAAHKATFFTIGITESRAWLINDRERAVEAAGKIHKDIARGFIRAEVVALQDYLAHGPWKQLKGSSYVREEGKDYPVRDGDVLNVRFSA